MFTKIVLALMFISLTTAAVQDYQVLAYKLCYESLHDTCTAYQTCISDANCLAANVQAQQCQSNCNDVNSVSGQEQYPDQTCVSTCDSTVLTSVNSNSTLTNMLNSELTCTKRCDKLLSSIGGDDKTVGEYEYCMKETFMQTTQYTACLSDTTCKSNFQAVSSCIELCPTFTTSSKIMYTKFSCIKTCIKTQLSLTTAGTSQNLFQALYDVYIKECSVPKVFINFFILLCACFVMFLAL